MAGLIPEPTPTDLPYWEAAREGRLALPRCDDCGIVHFPPGIVCAACYSRLLTWSEMSGRGTIWSWVVFHRQYFSGMPPPYTVVRVKLEEGPFLMGNLLEAEGTEVRMEAPVRIVFKAEESGFVLPQFVLAER